MNFRCNFEYFSTVAAQTILLFLSAVIVIFLFYKPVKEFNPIGHESFIMKVTPEVVAKWGKEPAHVKTGFLIHEFLQSDAIKNNFLISAVISFEFDPTQVTQEALDKFSFSKGDIIRKSDPLIRKISDHLTFVQYYVYIQFSALFDYVRFPLDDHRISLNLTNNTLEAQNVIFDAAPEDFSIPPYVSVSGWDIISHKPIGGYVEFKSLDSQSVRHPKVLFTMDVKKHDLRQLFLLFLPMFMLFYITMFILAIQDFTTDLTTSLFVITAFMANAIVIQGISPNAGYFMMLDYFVLFFLAVMFIVFLINFLCTLPEEKFSRDTLAKVRGFSVICIYIMLIAVTYYLTNVYKIGA